MNKPQQNSKRWLHQAQRDLDDALFARKGSRFNLACFLAQQATEKALKGLLYAFGAEEVWGHSVGELCLDVAQFDEEFKDLHKKVAILDKYYVPTRYPDALPGGIPADAFDDQDAERAVTVASDVIGIIEEKIKHI